MKVHLAIEWFLNPDHLPFIIAERMGIFKKNNIEFTLIEPDEHYDGLEQLKAGTIQFATNEPLHLIEQFHPDLVSLGMFFETKGGVLLKTSSYEKLKNGGSITVTTPVSNETTDKIGFEIIRRFYALENIEVRADQVTFVPNGFEHLKYMLAGADAGWLYFYNFEGIEAEYAGIEVLYLDADTAGFANFSALDLFVNRRFCESHPQECENFVSAVHEAIDFIHNHPESAMELYYNYTGTDKTVLMDRILKATMQCFRPGFTSNALQELPILEFFREIGITDLSNERFQSAFAE